MSRLLAFAGALIVAASSALAFATPAAGHETRAVGPYRVVVGWLNEPAFVGSQNAVDLRVTDATTNTPVDGLAGSITVEVMTGGLAPITLPLRARFGAPGSYAADLIPTQVGSYTFRFSGRIGTTDFNQVFESGPGRFGDIEPVVDLQYPEQVPAGADLTRRIAELQTSADQLRVLAVAAIALAAASLALTLVRRRT